MKSVVLALSLLTLPLPAQDPPETSGQNCTFLAAPDEFLSRESRVRRDAYERTLAFSRALPNSRTTVDPSQIPVRSFIDEEIFRRLQNDGVPSAALTTDEEFLRRVTLDLTGRIPSSADIRAFVADSNPEKRDTLIDQLIASPEFGDKWAVWLGDLLQNAATAQNRSQQIEGRNRLHEYIRDAIYTQKSWRDIAFEMVAAAGNNYDRETPGANFILRGQAVMGPAQDTYDLLLVRSASAFLGISHYDCVLCHNGKFHLELVHAWGVRTTRLEAWRMAAHFSRVTLQGYPGNDPANFYTNSTTVLERPTGAYDLNTNFGNRPNRTPVTIDGRSVASLTPIYRDGVAAPTTDWRAAFAAGLVRDPMFARNFANRIWKAMFNLALAEPVDGLDPLRLDPAVTPPDPWTHQASHPWLLEKLAQYARDNDFNLRDTLRFIARSSAYQLSSRYDADWDITKAPLFARHIPRRLEAEEVHDAIVKATGVMPSYAVGGWADRVSWAMQLPEPLEPRSDGAASGFMNSFNRGNRDTLQRSQSGSILMWLNMMNNSLVTNRVRTAGNPSSAYLASLAANKSNDAVVEELFFTFLSRSPTEYEKGVALKTLVKATTAQYTRAMAVEDLAWALINKTDFMFSY
ncbi:MAG: DUF1549 domain-containing protein [Candidatus Solibacter usitatus]|nr:DUF1549 domain-containing protein [Candidatus Solibacter usitatus]